MEKLTQKEQSVLQKIREFLSTDARITIRKIQDSLGYASPRSISVILDQLMRKGWIYRDAQGDIQISPDFRSDGYSVREIPLIGAIACGMPIFAEENIETRIPVSTTIATPQKSYFFLRAQGDSMDKKNIFDGDLVLIEETSVANPGQIIVALINDEATLKEFQPRDGIVYLIPHSTNPRHKPIILDEYSGSIQIQGIFVKAFPGSLFLS